MIEYIAAGNVMIDTVEFLDSPEMNRMAIGGPATFAYSGIKLWTDNVIQCSKLGADYLPIFKPWIEKNNIDTSGLKVICERCNRSHIVYQNRDGAPGMVPTLNNAGKDFFVKGTRWEDFGFMKTSPEDIEAFTKQGGVKGVYLAQNCDRVFWEKIREIKERDGFKMMWEIEGSVAYKEFLPSVIFAAEIADIFSINIGEAERLFEVEGDEACIAELQKLPVSMTLFRVGSRGLYAVTPTDAYYLPPVPSEIVDPTGCGNTSTGAALFAFANGDDPLMVGIKANIAAAQNIRQFGVIPDMLGVRQESYELADKLYEEYSKKYLK